VNFAEYQAQASETAIYGAGIRISYPALGLAGEAGEVCNKVKKIFRDNNGVVSEEKKADLSAEIGDVLWYCSALAKDLGLSLEDIAKANIAKLHARRNAGTIQGSGDNR
jgi:NTP pyrophosphatase (non-canonical NTP hydrolase)